MKYIIVLILATVLSCTGSKQNEFKIKIIPQPESVKESVGFNKLAKRTSIFCSEGVTSSVINTFSDQVKDYLTLEKGQKGKSDIEIIIEPGKTPEAYSLQVNKNRILISEGTINGAFNGLQSLRQLICQDMRLRQTGHILNFQEVVQKNIPNSLLIPGKKGLILT